MRIFLTSSFCLLLAGALSAAYAPEYKGIYGGNSDGQGKNAVAGGPDLGITGTVTNPSSPTPPEGDRWLAQGSPNSFVDVVNYMQHPLFSALGMTQDEGLWAATLNFQGATSSGQMINASASPFFSVYVTNGRALWADITWQEGGTEGIQPAMQMNATGNNIVRVEWDAAGFRIYLNGSESYSNVKHPAIIATGNGADGRFGNVGCCGFRVWTQLIDLIVFATDSSAAYPPVPIGGATPRLLLDYRSIFPGLGPAPFRTFIQGAQ